MAGEATKTCVECQGATFPIVITDKIHRSTAAGPAPQGLQYRRPDDKRSFWTGKYPTAGPVRTYLRGDCGRIALNGSEPNPDAAADGGGR